jgi:hypothetical protein
MQDDREAERRPIFRDDEGAEEEGPGPDILPADAPRGGITVPDANDTGMTTPPISGWGEVPVDEDLVDR